MLWPGRSPNPNHPAPCYLRSKGLLTGGSPGTRDSTLVNHTAAGATISLGGVTDTLHRGDGTEPLKQASLEFSRTDSVNHPGWSSRFAQLVFHNHLGFVHP